MPEPQYRRAFALPRQQLGSITNQLYLEDPRLLAIKLARYKHTAKLLHGKGRVLEVGCGDQFCTPLIRQEVNELVTLDFDPAFSPDVVHDMVTGPTCYVFDAAYALDVIEHIAYDKQDIFVEHVCQSLDRHGVFIAGTPNKTSEPWAAADTKRGHVGWLGYNELFELMGRHFYNVFILGMNDETLHTGLGQMCHYLLAIGVEQR